MYASLVASTLPVDGPIEEDIPRTMYDHELFCRKSRVNGREMLRRVLTAYGRYDREVRYYTSCFFAKFFGPRVGDFLTCFCLFIGRLETYPWPLASAAVVTAIVS